MASLLNNLFGGNQPEQVPVPDADSDFASFADAADPAPEGLPLTGTADALTNTLTFDTLGAEPTGPIYTKWYNVHERHSLSEFRAEGAILAVAAVIIVVHTIGSRANRTKAKAWIRAHATALRSEFSLVGFGGIPSSSSAGTYPPAPLSNAEADALLKEKSLFEFSTYATGRQNVAFADINITLTKKFNPMMNLLEHGLGYMLDSFDIPRDRAEVVLYPFDGREGETVPVMPGSGELRAKDSKSTYDNFVFGVVNKSGMQKVRDERFDISITYTRESPKLPNWLTVMSENAEITEALLTPAFIKVVEQAGELLDYVIITDQPSDKPKVAEDAAPRKRVCLRYQLPSNNDYTNLLPLFEYFLRLPDMLVQTAHFRAEVQRKIKAVRDDMIVAIQKMGESEKTEERAAERDRAKKAKRDAELKGLDAKGQKKYLEREKEKELRKSSKRVRA